MAVQISPIAHRVRRALPVRVTSGHAHELIAAALGYGSYAAYLPSVEEPASFAGVEHIVLDVAGLAARQQELGYVDPPAGPTFIETLRSELCAAAPGAKVHLGESDFADDIRQDVELAIADSGEFLGEQAMTNAYGPDDSDLEFDPAAAMNQRAADWSFTVVGDAFLEQDLDKVYHGDEIAVTARVEFQKIGRRMLAGMEVHEVGASIKGEEDLKYEPGPPR